MSAIVDRVLKPLRRYLLEGLIIVGPVGLTAFVLWWLFQRLDGILGRYLYPALEHPVPGLGLALLLVLLVATGWIAERALGKRVVQRWDEIVRRLPLARRIYDATSRIIRTILGSGRFAFREVVLFEYPSEGRWTLGFVTGPAPAGAREEVGAEGLTVYLPTAPNPMSGYLVVLPRSEVKTLDVTVEEAFTYVVSAGAVSTERAASALAETGDAGTRSPEGRG